jgi:positive regulator of sigma E activity
MARHATVVVYIVPLVAVVVGVDVLFFRDRVWVWERLMVNIGIALVFTAFYLRFLKHP